MAAQEIRLAPNGDHFGPQILHDAPTGTVPGRRSLTIDAIVTDNVRVAKVILFLRPLGSRDYAEMEMTATAGDRYAAVLDAARVVGPGIEYYIQAEDRAGNTTMRGYSLAPLQVAVGAPANPPRETPPRARTKPKEKEVFIPPPTF